MPTLGILESLRLARRHGIKFIRGRHAKTPAELKKALNSVGFPCAIKVVSGKISHKTERGGVALGVRGGKDALEIFHRMAKLSGFEGVLVQEMASGTEVIIGGKRDPQFGPTVLFGLGGIFVEVFRDFSLGVCPLKRADARRMVKGIKGYKLLAGFRGSKPADIRAIEDAILAVSRLMQKEKQVLEIDLNPMFATEKGLLAADARVVV